MMRTSMAIAALLLVGEAGCDDAPGPTGASGLPSEKRLGDLDDGEWRSMCEFNIALLGGEGNTFECGGGGTVSAATVVECVAANTREPVAAGYDACGATVGHLERCAEQYSVDPCVPDLTGADCEAVVACYQ